MSPNYKKYRPPKFAQWLLLIFLTDYNRWAMLGDLEEEFYQILTERGIKQARWFYVMYLIKTIPSGLIHYFYWGVTMFKNYFKITLRNILRSKGYSFINILGLAIGISCAVLIYLYVDFETSYDNYHQDVERLFRVNTHAETQTEETSSARTSGPIGPSLKETFPQIETFTRILPLDPGLIKYEDKMFYEERIFGDSELFNIFTTTFVRGSKDKVLDRPNTCVISESVAKKFFGNDNPVGKIIYVKSSEYEVTAVISDSPQNTHSKFSVIMSLSTIKDRYPWEHWFLVNFFTYIKIKPNVDVNELQNQVSKIYKLYIPDQLADLKEEYSLSLLPINEIHLNSSFSEQIANSGNITALRILSVAGILIILIAAINFINLSTARSAKRAREVGVRKVIGGYKSQLMMQFLGETFFVCLLAVIIALGLIIYGLKLLKSFGGVDLSVNDLLRPEFFLFLIILMIITAIVAGTYPSFILSSFKPSSVLKGGFSKSVGRAGLRKLLVIFQFTASVFLIISTLMVLNQISFMKNQKLGFNKEHKLVLPMKGTASITRTFESVREEFRGHTSIKSVCVASHTPGEYGMNYFDADLATESGVITKPLHSFYVDPDYINDLDLKIIAGRNYRQNSKYDEKECLILNRKAAEAFGFSDPSDILKKQLVGIFDTAIVIGVVEDFHYWGLQNEIEPAILDIDPRFYKKIILSVKDNPSEAVAFAKSKWEELFPGNPFEYYFLDEEFDKLYKSEEMFGSLFGYFASLGLFIACLGLIGLASFTAEQKTKEIGIRKVLGSSVIEIIKMLSADFAKWVIIGNLIAWPIAFYFMTKWLEDFAYRAGVNYTHFILTALITLFIALFTVSYQSIKAAKANPIDALKYE